MNRRSFLLGIGMVACSSPAKISRKRHAQPTTVAYADPESSRAIALYDLQQRASPLAFHGDTLVQSYGGELRVWDALSMKRTHTWTVPHRHLCFVQDGTLVAFGWPSNDDIVSVVHRISKNKLHSHQGPLVVPSNSAVVLPAGRPDELYIITNHIYYLQNTEVPMILPHPYAHDPSRQQWVSRGNGQLVGGTMGAVYILESAQKPAIKLPILNRELKHLVAATNERVWYSYTDVTDSWNAHTLVLAPATAPMADEHSIDLAPCRIVHLASFRNTVAALLMSMGPTIADMNWKLAVFEENGKERWRADLADTMEAGIPLNRGFVAIGEHRVVVAQPDGSLRAWNAADGREVTLG